MVGDNADLLVAVAQLWITPGDIVADATFGRGVFWADLPGLPHYAFDKLTGHDLAVLPLADASVDVLALDPPYRPTHGSRRNLRNNQHHRYQLGDAELDTIEDVLDLYRKGCVEAARVLRPEGRVLVKCQDMSYSHRLHLVSMDVLRIMVESGFDMVDQFLLVGGSNLSSRVWARQERARRNHSVLWVGVKL